MTLNAKRAALWGAGVLAIATIAGGSGYWLGLRGGPVTENDAGQSGRKILYWYDPMVPAEHYDNPNSLSSMGMKTIPKYADEAEGDASVKIDPALSQSLGMRTATARMGTLGSAISATGVIAFNQRDVAIVQPRAGGFVQRTYARAPDDLIRAGAPIVDLLVPDWGGAQMEYLATLRTGNAELARAARQRLTLLGMPASTISAVENGRRTSTVYTVSAPIGGTISTLDVRPGMTVSAGEALAQINGLSSVWLDAAVPEAVAGSVSPGQPVTVALTAFPGETRRGRIRTILPKADDQSRTLTVRIELPNPGLKLRPGMFAQVNFTGNDRQALLVPSEAVIQTGKRAIVMLALDKGRYRAAEVRTGQTSNGQTEILAGLSQGEKVVTSGQFLIDSEASLSGMDVRPINAASTSEPAKQSTKPATYETRGVIQKIAPSGITLKHEPVPALQWPAMTMTFGLQSPALARGFKVGDRVRFTFSQDDAGPTIRSMAAEVGQ
ncbi:MULTISPECIES: efflux RND transporter periplasmic adaptor subunit [Novosphingobium]|uniref:Efflux RND transporter periplasmic adaptor subunit n=1 Tax=Novosphingobium mangrovi (ex Huang et al. 2023) TaxID=2976432 RepID=A0ABT2I6E3_9SPHN|nr:MULTISPECIES: efflux RND transporter periplasmic adaptor subunit [Novosphingobium]MCT2400122.1 efflux RND transporter periplasmic adaptor subunit [Novosphingobium mangrovi (ex Huang et al. 2023)]CCA93118.1 Cu(I)/Ag(I) efflux system membrane protein CusB [Novosphingobium sp. PP1Y]